MIWDWISKSSQVLLHVVEGDEQGLWILAVKEDGDHVILVPWKHIKALDIAKGEVRAEGPIN